MGTITAHIDGIKGLRRGRHLTASLVAPGDPVVDGLVSRARAAQRQIEEWSEERIDVLLHALASAVADHAHALAVDTVAETGRGNVPDKTAKIVVASFGVYQQLAGQIGHGEISYDRDRKVAEIASPVGVILGLVPATHPVATFVFKVLIALKGRNAIILSPSRRAQQVSQQVGQLIQRMLGIVGAPPDIVQWLEAGSGRQATEALMNHPHVGLVLATGGYEMVQAAYRSGKPAIGVGPGNAPVLISADADLDYAASSIVKSKSFDNGMICGAENHLIVEAAARTPLLAALERHGAAILTPSESERFRKVAVSVETERLLPAIIGQDAMALADLAAIDRPFEIRLLVIPTNSPTVDNYLAAEKLAPVLSLFTVPDMNEGMALCRELLDVDGPGHTAIIHTSDRELTRRFAAAMPVSRILINSPATQGLIGLTTGLVPSMTLGCGTWGGSSTTNNVTYRDLLNIKRVAYSTEHS